ncbi:MAG: histidine kinase, partial [Alteromonadaceae bacterium]
VDSPAAEFVRVELPLSHEIPFLIPDDRDVISVDSRSVLIVEDDRSFASVLKGIAHQKDYSCLVAGNGQCALQLAKKYSPSAILLDVNLPDIDGLKLLSLFKQDLNTRHIPVHVITGRECMGESLAQGAVGFLHKPTDSEEIDNVFAIFDHYLSDRNKRILLIEDNQQYRSSLIKLLENKDVSIIEAATGKEGIKQLKNNDFDCVILDMQLPDVSGEEILRQLSQFKTKPLPPIIINTGKELSEDLFKELNKYTEEIIIKGTESAERLLDEVTLFLHQAESNLPDNQRKTLQMLHDDSVALQGYTVLMVDDDLRNCFALTNLLEGHGLEVIVAENGQVALDRLAQHPQIDLVLMDIMMPVMDGYEAIEKIRAQEQYLNLPIIALTAKAMAEDKRRCLEIGASDYMNKPIDNDRLLSLIKVTLH